MMSLNNSELLDVSMPSPEEMKQYARARQSLLDAGFREKRPLKRVSVFKVPHTVARPPKWVEPVTPDMMPAEINTPTLEEIRDRVLFFHGMRLNDFEGKRRPTMLAIARHHFWYLARRHTLHSFPEMARFVGGRDHSTALSGAKRFEARLKERRKK